MGERFVSHVSWAGIHGKGMVAVLYDQQSPNCCNSISVSVSLSVVVVCVTTFINNCKIKLLYKKLKFE